MSAPSLQRRLVWLVLGMVSVAWLLATAATWSDSRHELDELLDSHLAQAAALLVVQQAGELGEDGQRVETPSLHRYAPRVTFQVFHEGRLVVRSANAPVAPLLDSARGPARGFTTVRIDGAQWRVFAAHGAERDVQVYVGERLDARREILVAVLRSVLWPLVVVLPLLAAAVWWAVRYGLRPLHRLGERLVARRPDALEPLPEAGLPLEMRPMVAALNGLLGRIAGLIGNERRFTADAAHELRTPIAAIRAQAQVALGETDDAARRQALLRTVEGCDRAAHLIGQLLTLARLDAGAAPPLAPLDLAALARSVVAELAPEAVARDQALEWEDHRTGAAPDSRCLVPGDETLLRVLLRNLLENAIRYAGSDARIVVSLAGDAAHFVLAVADSGPGLADDQRVRLGERFHRPDGSAASGSGLGWSICLRICAVHGFALDSGRAPDLGGLQVAVSGACAASSALQGE